MKTAIQSIVTTLALLAFGAKAAPANDNFADRVVLLGNSLCLTNSNSGATKETGETNHAAAFGYTASGMSVWYAWTPDVGGYVKFTLTGNFNKVIAAYTGSSVTGLS